jgi:hypothetical protein
MTSLKIGLEKEYFISDGPLGKLLLAPSGLAHDGCGWLAEARGEPFGNVTEAVFSLLASEYRLKSIAAAKSVTLLEEPIMKVPRALRLEAARRFVKGLVESQNLYGHASHRLSG